MSELRRYRKREDERVVAVRLALDTEGFSYKKWGGEQRCRAGDWIVDNGNEVYTVAADVFSRTYSEVGRGIYRKHATVLARRVEEAGTVNTREGATEYSVGDYLVMNEGREDDVYAVEKVTFERMYEML